VTKKRKVVAVGEVVGGVFAGMVSSPKTAPARPVAAVQSSKRRRRLELWIDVETQRAVLAIATEHGWDVTTVLRTAVSLFRTTLWSKSKGVKDVARNSRTNFRG